MALLAVAAAALVLALVVAAGPLFVSSVGTAGLHAAAAKECVQDNQISVINPQSFPLWAGFLPSQTPDAVSRADPLVHDAFADQGLPAPVISTYTAVPTDTGSPAQPDLLGLLATPGALEHVTVLSRVPGEGIYLTDTYAADRGLQAGDQLSLSSGQRLRIAGVYSDLDTASYRTVLPDFWCHWRNLIVSTVSNQPPPLALADPAIVAAQGAEVAAEWTSPIDVDALTVAEARAAATAGDRLLSPAQTDEDNPGSVVSGYAERTNLDFNLTQTDKLQTAVGTPVLAIAAAGAVLSMVLVTGAVLFWVRRRRAELTMLSARGVGPAALGAKAVAELALPAAVGCAVGWGLGLWLVPVLGPSPLTEPGAPGRALLAVGVALLVSLVVMLVVAAVALGEHRVRASSALRFVPPLMVVGLLGAAWALFDAADSSRLILLGVYRVDPALLLAPLLALAGVVLAAALLVAAPLGRARVATRRRGFAVFAAVNRAAAARGPLVVVICGLAVPVGLAVYAAGFTASTQATVTAKTEIYAVPRSRLICASD
ncbi:MAG TPA: FtsX-like permease family protein [Mycobacteriales bacterium]